MKIEESMPKKGLIIKKRWLDLILSGQKVWEIRGSNTKNIGLIGLIESGTGKIIGTAELTAIRALTLKEYQESQSFHCIPEGLTQTAPYKNIYAWELKNAVRFEKPIPYSHPQGAVIWVNL